MTQSDAYSLLVIGGVFILLGVGAIIWDRLEKKRYLNAISHHADTREFLEGWPKRPQFGALKTGGWIAIIIGLLMLLVGGTFPIWG